GDTVEVGETIARIDEGGATASSSKSTASDNPQKSQASPGGVARDDKSTTTQAANPEDLRPSVRRIVEENKLDPSKLHGTGPGGKVTKEDAVRATSGSKPAGPRIPPGKREAAVPDEADEIEIDTRITSHPSLPSEAAQVFSAAGVEGDGVKRVALSKLRKRIADNLVRAQQTAAILTTFNEVDMSAIFDIRGKYKERFQEVHGVGLGFMSFFARAAVLGLREFPRINAFLDGDDILYHSYVHLGIAVSTDRGLAVPVLRNIEQMSFAKIESEIKRLANATREGKLGLQELSGGTFTITNGGIFGSLLSTPILNTPQSGILGMHNIVKRPVAINDKVEIRPMMYVALSYDHRLVDGRESVSFLVRMKQLLEDPARLMLEI
ncbi:MAG: 2-oxoglutarate dehydrogenase complex dihydrolipoyllysine-residue succinyltransferase, partial [Chthoniobacterales bacterium]|nr:2-oxoglutarate dehydrogenase complex dihydrolipoyllysine-residue succinyltransferase [Chthoniobacterales bacterium]